MINEPRPPHTPYAHKDHNDNIPCGCMNEKDIQEKKEVRIVCQCGATYHWSEVVTFPSGAFRCYDCGRVFINQMDKMNRAII